MSSLATSRRRQDLRPRPHHQERRPRGAGRRLHGLRRPLGLRQVDPVADDRRPRAGDLGRHPARRQAGQRGGGRPARPRHGVPVLCPLPAYERAPEPRLRLENSRTPRAEIEQRVDEAADMLASASCCSASRASSRAGSASGSRSAGRSSAAPASSCSTSRSRTSMPSCASPRAASSPGCSAASAPP